MVNEKANKTYKPSPDIQGLD